MDDLFPILMFIIFILAPIIEGLKRKNKNQQQPPSEEQQQRRTPAPQGRRTPAPRTEPRLPQPSRTEEVSAKAPTAESAATMVPDDLWEILTGQTRSPAPTTPQPQPQPRQTPQWNADLDTEEEEAEAATERYALEDVNVEYRRTPVEAQSLEKITRHEEPIIISLEENLPSAAQRHAAFHRQIAEPVPIVVLAPKRKLLFNLGNRAELQRAFLLKEILGPPKGLE